MNVFNSIRNFLTGNPKPDRILITGYPKTGTTFVYHSIREQLPREALCQFEPEHRDMPVPGNMDVPILVKSFVPYSEKYDHFNKKILIVRDPRDTFISGILYRPYNTVLRKDFGSEAKTLEVIDRIISLLKKKEKDPSSVSLREIHNLFKNREFRLFDRKVINYYKEREKLFLLKYEDFVDGNYRDLEKYLDIRITGNPEIPEKRVIRSKAYGNWRDWFTPEDVNHYRSMFTEYMNVFGYEDEWNLNEKPVIDPEVSSKYVARIVEEAKGLIQPSHLPKPGLPGGI